MAEIIDLRTNNPYGFPRGLKVTFSERTELWWGGFDYSPRETDIRYEVSQDDTLDDIIYKFGRNIVENYNTYYWAILGANSSIFINPFDLSGIVGTVIIIPDILGFEVTGGD